MTFHVVLLILLSKLPGVSYGILHFLDTKAEIQGTMHAGTKDCDHRHPVQLFVEAAEPYSTLIPLWLVLCVEHLLYLDEEGLAWHQQENPRALA